LSAVIGLFRGFFREAMSLVVWIAAVWVASRYAEAVAPQLALIANAHLRIWGARLLLLIGVLIAGGITAWLIAQAIHSSRLGGADRSLGVVFGLARGVVLAALAVITLELAGFSDESWWRQSKLIPYAAAVADALRDAAKQRLGQPRSLSASGLPDVANSSFRFRSR
jgi:membrane protein required for colicin V production